MADKDHKEAATARREAVNDMVDRELDAALAKYAAVEPRPGLEERVLVNLRSNPRHVTNGVWWRWGLAAAALTVVVVTLALAWRSGRPSHTVVANHPLVTVERPSDPERSVTLSKGGTVPTRKQRRIHSAVRNSVQPEQVLAKDPKLDQFPSPQPPSDQEKMLARYVAQFHDEAVLIARARTAASKQDLEEMQQTEAGSADKSQAR